MAITSYEVQVEHPCKAISLSPFAIGDQDNVIGDEIGLEMSISDASISPANMINRCPNIKHTYSYGVVCGSIESDWLTLDSEKHFISIKTPETIEQQGKQVKV